MWQKNFHFHSFSLLASQGSDQSRGAFRDSQLNPSTQPYKLHVSTKDHPQKHFVVFQSKSLLNENSRNFSRNFTSRSRSRGIFNSLFTLDLDFETFSFHFSLSISISRHFHFTFHSRNEWTRFSFHFSLLEMSEPDFHFTFHFSNFQYPLSQDTAEDLRGHQKGLSGPKWALLEAPGVP